MYKVKAFRDLARNSLNQKYSSFAGLQFWMYTHVSTFIYAKRCHRQGIFSNSPNWNIISKYTQRKRVVHRAHILYVWNV